MGSTRRHPVRTAIIGVLAAFTGLWVGMTVLWRQKDKRFLSGARRFNRAALNHVTLRVAGKPHSIYAAIEHTGRRTGHTHQTPVIAVPAPGAFIVPLPYGESNWHRNALKAGTTTVYWQGSTYITSVPEHIEAKEALAFFSLSLRLVFRAYNVDQFVRLPISAHHPAPAAAPEAEVHA